MLNYAQQFGEFVTIVIENMSEEHHNIERGLVATDMEGNLALGKEEKKEKEEEPTVEKELGFVAVSSGKGLDRLFQDLGVDVIVSGGQTMNPSTEDFVHAIKRCRAKNVVVLPNNSNIVMAASQACDVLEGSEISARVVPSKTIPQGLVSAVSFDCDGDPKSVYEAMKAALKTVKSGSVTYAVRDTEIEGVRVTKDDYMAMMDKNIVSCVKNRSQALYDLVDALIDEDSFMITVLVGEDVPEEEVASVKAKLQEKHGDQADIVVERGDQPIYSYLVGVE